MKLIKALRVMLTIQLSAAVLAMLITFITSHDGSHNFYGLLALLPMGVFVLLGVINLILLAVYFVKLANKALPADKRVFTLAIINLSLVLLDDLFISLLTLGGE